MTERSILRKYAQLWQEIAHRAVMAERKAVWTAINDLKPIRPAVLVETCLMTDYVVESDLMCIDGYLRQLEKYMIENIRHADEVGDDFILEPYIRIPWDVDASSFGVEIKEKHATDTMGDTVACTFEHPILKPEAAELLKPRTFEVKRELTQKKQQVLNELFGDILPVMVGGTDPVYGAGGYSPFCGLYITEITLNLYKLIGMNNFYFWLFDEPDLIHRLMQFVLDDFICFHLFLEKERLLVNNADYSLTGGRYGYVSEQSSEEPVLSNLWLWCNAEETTTLSPEMYAEFIMPYLKQSANLFGKTYFGCCENIDSRWDQIKKEIANLKAVSVSPFNNVKVMAELLGRDYVFSKKPQPSYIAQSEPDWAGAKKDAKETVEAAGCGVLEIILRDVYRTYGNRSNLSKWVDMVKSLF